MRVNYYMPSMAVHDSVETVSKLKNFGLKTIILFSTCLLMLSLTDTVNAAEYSVASANDFNALCATLTGGDVVTWEDGTYSNQNIEFYATGGTASNPIILKAQTSGKVIFNGSSEVNISGNYLVMDGFYWNGGEGTSEHIEFRKDGSQTDFAENCTIKNSAFNNLTTTAPSKSRWIVLHGYNNVVENCSFVNKESTGAAILVELWYQGDETAGHIIRNNYFYNITKKDDYSANTGDCEAIRVGVSSRQSNDAGVTVEGNYFQKADGENEIITNKSSNNKYLHNTFRNCRGSLVLRHGSNATVDGNFFLGEGKSNSGGIRVTDSYHTIINNYMQGLSNDGDSWNNGITIVSGNEATGGSSNGYQYVDDVLIAFNTIYNSDDPIYFNDKYSYVSSGTIAYNLIYSENGAIVAGDIEETGAGMTFTGNIFGGYKDIGIPNGYTSGDAGFSTYGEIFKPSSTGAAADAAGAAYSSKVTTDIEGISRPSNNMDVGSFEVSGGSGSTTYTPITNSDVRSSVGSSFIDESGEYVEGETVNVDVTGVNLTATATVSVGNTTTLSATISPSNATTKTVSYSSSNESVVTVSTSGVVTGLSEGSGIITVTTTDGNYTATSTITVETASLANAPYEIVKFQNYLAQCKLQSPLSNTEATASKIMDNYSSSSFFVVDGDKMAFTQSRDSEGTSQRTELRFEENWYINDISKTLHSNMKIEKQTCTELTVLQIHDDANGNDGPNKPLLRVYQIDSKLYAAIKTDAGGVSTTHADLGTTPSGYFDCDITVKSGTMTISVNGTEMVSKDVSYWTYPSYWKNGVYLQDAGEATTYFNELTLTDAGSSTTIAATAVTLTTSATVRIGETTSLTATVSPSNATIKTVSYRSSNESIATVSTSGVVTGVKEGLATITVTTTDGSFTATSVITVNAASGSTLIPSDLMRNPNQWKITYPNGEEDKTLDGEANNEYFYVSDEDDAIVFFAPVRSDNGTTPNSDNIRSELREREEDGSTDIYWTTTGKHVLYVEQAITHLPINFPNLVAAQIHGNKTDGIDDAMVVRLEDQHLFLSFNGAELRSNLTIKTDYVLGTKHEVIFEVIDGKHYVYYSEDGNLLTAYENGNASAYLVRDEENNNDYVMDLEYDQSYFKVGNYTQSNPIKEGDDTDDPNNYGEVFVYDFLVSHDTTSSNEPVAVTGVDFSSVNVTVAIDGTTQLTAEFTPSNATDKGVTYASNDELVATVDANGLVTGVSEGTATITVTTDDGSFTATSEITVQGIPTGLTNVALNKTVTATTTTDEGSPEANLVDGSTDTKMALSGYPQTITIDLGALYDISYSELVFYNDRAYQYTISVATDESGSYTEVVDRSSNETGAFITDYFTTIARYVQITVTGANVYDGTWVSLSEFRVLGILDEATSIKSLAPLNSEEVTVYPNPVMNTLNVITDKTGTILLVNRNGQEVKTLKKGKNSISEFPKSMYYIVVKENGKIEVVAPFYKIK